MATLAAAALVVAGAVGGGTLLRGRTSSPPVRGEVRTTTAGPPVLACRGGHGVPGGDDPWGGCWPGDWNTGYPHGLPGDVRPAVTLARYDGPCEIRGNDVVIEARLVTCPGVLVYGRNLTIRNSMVRSPVNTNSPRASVTVVDSEIDGLDARTQAVGLTNVTLLRVDVHGNQHGVHCYGHCTVRDSYLHDQYADGKAQGWHQNGFLTNGGTDMRLVHNTVGCRGGCTSPLTLVTDDDISHVVLDRNLVLASDDSAYCINAGSNHPVKPGDLDHVSVIENVFQRGRGGRCGLYGVVGGWVPGNASNGNVWRGNTMDDGTALVPS